MGKLTGFINNSRKKNIKIFYQLSSLFDIYKPLFVKRMERRAALSAYDALSTRMKNEVDRRVEFYNKLFPGTQLHGGSSKQQVYKLSDIKMKAVINGRKTRSAYSFDIMRLIRSYNQSLDACFIFGDVSWIPERPSFVKSRPISDNNVNSVILPLNRIRHFNFINDSSSFESKLDMLMGVSFAKQQNRQDFLRLYFGHPLCRVGSAYRFEDERKEWNVDYVSIVEQLKYKFILCLEGNDVATNLKWVMSSNSIAVMPKPKFETWFMESTLVGGEHYIEIADDYSDLEEKINYYTQHTDKAQKIVAAAHKHIEQFRNKKIENIVSIRVVDKYFSSTGQL